MVKLIYTFFLGLLLAMFIGVGISTFYVAPTPPETPALLSKPIVSDPTPEEKAQLEQNDQQQKQFAKALSVYNRNVSIISLAGALVLLIIALVFTAHLDVVADGILLGSVFTLVYSIGRGLASEDPAFRFIVTSIGLVVALALGYSKFIRPAKQ